MNTNLIGHTGTIKSIDDQHLVVKIISLAACSSCNARNACPASDKEEKFIDIYQNQEFFTVGEEVLVTGTSQQGKRALFFAYLFPLMLLTGNLFLFINITGEEAIAALLSIAFLLPYYLLLYFFRNKLQNSFLLSIQKLPKPSANE